MKQYLALSLLLAALPVSADVLTVDFNGAAIADCDEGGCAYGAGPLRFEARYPGYILPGGNPDNAFLELGKDLSGAILDVSPLDGSNIRRFAVVSFDVFLVDPYEDDEYDYQISLRSTTEWPVDFEEYEGVPANEWHTVTPANPEYADTFFLQAGSSPTDAGQTIYIDNIVIDAIPYSFDISAIVDLSSDAIADFTMLPLQGLPEVAGVASSNGDVVSATNYFNSAWQPVAHDVIRDGNLDGVANDPLVAVLGRNDPAAGNVVQVRSLAEGAPSNRFIGFFNEQYTAIDVAVLNDTSGDGVPNDPSIAVLGEKSATGRQAVMLRRVSDGALLGNWTITHANQVLLGITAVSLPGGGSRISVLTRDAATSDTVIRSIRVADGVRLPKQRVAGPFLEARDLAIQDDGDGNGIADDPLYVLLAEKVANGNQLAWLVDAVSGAKVDAFRLLNNKWTAHSIAVSQDLNGDSFPDLLTAATKDANGKLIVNVRELDSGDKVENLFPVVESEY